MTRRGVALARQGGRYGIGAVGAALTDWLLFLLLEFMAAPLLAAQMAARVGGGLFSFVVSKHWSFQSGQSRQLPREIRFFLLLYLASYGLSIGLFHWSVTVLGSPAYSAKLAVDTLCFLFNFLMMRLHVFPAPAEVQP